MQFKKIGMLAAALMAAFCAQAQQQARLNTGWEFLRSDLGGIWEAVRPVGKGNPEASPIWQKVTLPHCVNASDAVDPDVNYYQGPAWYRTQLKVDNPYANGRTLLHFEGAGQKTEVYIYTTKVASHTGGYDEWTADITDAVAAFRQSPQFKGAVPLSIRTDNSRDLEMIPSSLSDFNVYGGIYRYLNLVYTPAVYFSSVKLQSNAKTGEVSVSALTNTPAPAGTVFKAVIKDAAGKVLQEKSGGTPDMLLKVTKPRLWQTTDPVLYTVETSVTANGQTYTRTDKTGFRTFEFREKGPFFLNGKRLLLKGTHRHEDHAGVAAAMTEETMREEMILMKEMGVNFIRLGHYQQSRIILNLCDSLGILVWEEIPWCRGGLGGDVYKTQARRMLTNMINQHYNHPAVIIWGLGNENDWPGDFPEFDKEKIRAFMKELNDLSHQLDPSRKTAIRRCDFCKDIVDVYSPSIWAGWYRGIYTEYKQISEDEFNKVKHFLHVEWGGDSHAGRHSENPDNALRKIKTGNGGDERAGDASLYGGAARVSKDGDWSESYICNLMDWHLKEQETMPWLTGTAQWVFKDFSTPIRPDNPVPYMNQKGLVERDNTKKEAYYVFQSYWAEKPMARIYGHSWPVRWGAEGEEKLVKVYSNCDEAELFLNGKSLGKKKRRSADFPAAGLHWTATFNKGANELKVIAKKGKTVVEDAVSFQYQTEKWGKPSQMTLSKTGEENGIATLEVKMLDANNITCLDAANFVRFSLAGDGKLIDNLGTSSGSRYVQLYNGRAVIRVDLRKGKNMAAVSSEGIPTATLAL